MKFVFGKIGKIGGIGAVFALMAVLVTGCGGGASADGTWHFVSVEPSEATMSNLDDAAKADKQAEASMLAVFMSDAEVTFNPESRFAMTFLGQEYPGNWESSGGTYTVRMEDGDASSGSGTYRIDGDKLVFEASEGAGRLEGFTVVYERGGAPDVADDTQEEFVDDAEESVDAESFVEDEAIDETDSESAE